MENINKEKIFQGYELNYLSCQREVELPSLIPENKRTLYRDGNG